MHLAHIMSRSFLPFDSKGNQELEEFKAVNAVKFLSMREERIQEIRREMGRNEALQMLKATILQGWRDKNTHPTDTLLQHT